MSYSATFVVRGKPEPKGSTRAFMPKGARFPVVTSDNPKARGFADLVRLVAQEHAPPELLTGPVRVSLAFFLARPKSTPRKVVHHIKKPDVDKTVRAVLDALTGIVWRDDSQVVELHASKGFGAPGVVVAVTEVER